MGIDYEPHNDGGAEFAEVDTTFRFSIELEYLLNVVCFDYNSLQCKPTSRCTFTMHII